MFLDVIQKYTDFFVSWYSYSICTFCKQRKNSASNGILFLLVRDVSIVFYYAVLTALYYAQVCVQSALEK